MHIESSAKVGLWDLAPDPGAAALSDAAMRVVRLIEFLISTNEGGAALKSSGLLLLPFAAALLLTSCARMQAAHYVGEKEPIFAECIQGVSIWKSGDDVFFVKPLDEHSAIASTLKWNDEEAEFEIVNHEILVTKLSDTVFLNVKEDGLYTILRVVGTNEGPVLFTVDNSKFEKDIEAGRGRVKWKKTGKTGVDYVLDVTKEELDAYVAVNSGELFDFSGGRAFSILEDPGKDAAQGGKKPTAPCFE